MSDSDDETDAIADEQEDDDIEEETLPFLSTVYEFGKLTVLALLIGYIFPWMIYNGYHLATSRHSWSHYRPQEVPGGLMKIFCGMLTFPFILVGSKIISAFVSTIVWCARSWLVTRTAAFVAVSALVSWILKFFAVARGAIGTGVWNWNRDFIIQAPEESIQLLAHYNWGWFVNRGSTMVSTGMGLDWRHIQYGATYTVLWGIVGYVLLVSYRQFRFIWELAKLRVKRRLQARRDAARTTRRRR